MKKGRPCYYVREIARVDGKRKVVNHIYLGTVERPAGDPIDMEQVCCY